MEKFSIDNRTVENSSVATLEEALRLQTAAILAGVEVQQEILQAVREIQIGDDVIGSAISRYQQKMAVLNGGTA